MMFWCWSQCGNCSHFVTAASRHYPHHHQGPYHLLTGDWGIVKPAPAPAPAPLQTAAQGGWPVWPGPGATHGYTTEKIQLFTVSSNSRVQQLWYRCTLIYTILRMATTGTSSFEIFKALAHFSLVFKHGHSNAPESGMLFCKDHHWWASLCIFAFTNIYSEYWHTYSDNRCQNWSRLSNSLPRLAGNDPGDGLSLTFTQFNYCQQYRAAHETWAVGTVTPCSMLSGNLSHSPKIRWVLGWRSK